MGRLYLRATPGRVLERAVYSVGWPLLNRVGRWGGGGLDDDPQARPFSGFRVTALGRLSCHGNLAAGLQTLLAALTAAADFFLLSARMTPLLVSGQSFCERTGKHICKRLAVNQLAAVLV